jgi:acetyltransferase-like isoleucine patch superfamily enzyme
MTQDGQGDRIRTPLRAKLAYRLYLATMGVESTGFASARRRLLDAMLGRRHHALNIFPAVFIEGYWALRIGEHVSINRGCNLSAAGGLTIGDHVAIGHSTSILTGNHGFADPATPIKYQPVTLEPVVIGSNTWIGANVTILSGVTIADGTVVAAGAVVTKPILEPDTIVGGVPARFLRSRFD